MEEKWRTWCYIQSQIQEQNSVSVRAKSVLTRLYWLWSYNKKALNIDYSQTKIINFIIESYQLIKMYLWYVRKNPKICIYTRKCLDSFLQLLYSWKKKKNSLFWFTSPAFNSWTIWGNVPSRSIFNMKMNAFLYCFNCISKKSWASWGTTHSRRLTQDPKNSPPFWNK